MEQQNITVPAELIKEAAVTIKEFSDHVDQLGKYRYKYGFGDSKMDFLDVQWERFQRMLE